MLEVKGLHAGYGALRILRGIDMPVKFVTRQEMEALEQKRI